jgi:hypothetical protein
MGIPSVNFIHLLDLTSCEKCNYRPSGILDYRIYVKLRLHATICRVRFVFWRIKMSAAAVIHCRFVKKKFQMQPSLRVFTQ